MLHCDTLSKARKPCRRLLNALCGRHSGYRNAKTMFRIQQKLQVSLSPVLRLLIRILLVPCHHCLHAARHARLTALLGC